MSENKNLRYIKNEENKKIFESTSETKYYIVVFVIYLIIFFTKIIIELNETNFDAKNFTITIINLIVYLIFWGFILKSFWSAYSGESLKILLLAYTIVMFLIPISNFYKDDYFLSLFYFNYDNINNV